MFLNVELIDGSDNAGSAYFGWYYATLAVDGKIFGHLESGLANDISRGVVSEEISRPRYFEAGGLPTGEADFVFNNVGFSSENDMYKCELSVSARERAEKTLADRENAKISKAAEYLVEKAALETESGAYLIYPGDVPDEIMPESEFERLKDRIVDAMLEYEAVAEIDLDGGIIDVTMYLAYCPNYIPHPEEEDEYPDDREILDPLQTKATPEPEKAQPPASPPCSVSWKKTNSGRRPRRTRAARAKKAEWRSENKCHSRSPHKNSA